MKNVYKILSCDGSIRTIRRWTQDPLKLVYSFLCVHRQKMLQDVDTLSRHLDPLVVQHAKFGGFFRTKDISDRADAYSSSVFDGIFSSNKYEVKKKQFKY